MLNHIMTSSAMAEASGERLNQDSAQRLSLIHILQYESLLVAENSERQLGWNHQPPQVKGSHGWRCV